MILIKKQDSTAPEYSHKLEFKTQTSQFLEILSTERKYLILYKYTVSKIYRTYCTFWKIVRIIVLHSLSRPMQKVHPKFFSLITADFGFFLREIVNS